MEKLNPCNDLMDIFNEKQFIKVCAPMVRYSKLQFRTLVREYGCDLCFTPMILADSFCQSQKARDNEFSTNLSDTPLVVQFAANTVHDFVGAAYMVAPYCNGVDLNCGCPQRWARCQGIGSVLLEQPELISDLVRQCRNTISKPFTVSVKMRIFSDIKKTVSVCEQLYHAGVSFLTVHARTPCQHSVGPVSLDALKLISECVPCPIIANGGVKSLEDVRQFEEQTSCKGVMVANGLLTNPALFSGANVTPMHCVQRWLDICYNNTITSELITIDNNTPEMPERNKNFTFQCFHHHLVFMLEKILPRRSRTTFNNLQSFKDVFQFLSEQFHITPNKFLPDVFDKYDIVQASYRDRIEKYLELRNAARVAETNVVDGYDYNQSEGKFFKTKVCSLDDNDTCISSLFL